MIAPTRSDACVLAVLASRILHTALACCVGMSCPSWSSKPSRLHPSPLILPPPPLTHPQASQGALIPGSHRQSAPRVQPIRWAKEEGDTREEPPAARQTIVHRPSSSTSTLAAHPPRRRRTNLQSCLTLRSWRSSWDSQRRTWIGAGSTSVSLSTSTTRPSWATPTPTPTNTCTSHHTSRKSCFLRSGEAGLSRPSPVCPTLDMSHVPPSLLTHPTRPPFPSFTQGLGRLLVGQQEVSRR